MSSIANRLLNNLASQTTPQTQSDYSDFSTTFEGDEGQTTTSYMEDFATDFDSVDISSILSEDDATIIKGALGINVATQMTLEANYARLHAELSAA